MPSGPMPSSRGGVKLIDLDRKKQTGEALWEYDVRERVTASTD